jgi:hypothetical protein
MGLCDALALWQSNSHINKFVGDPESLRIEHKMQYATTTEYDISNAGNAIC